MRALLGLLCLLSVGVPAASTEAGEALPGTARLYCPTAAGEILPLRQATFARMIDAYEEKAGWSHWVEPTAPARYIIGFSPEGRSSDAETAVFDVETYRDGFVVREVTYRFEDQVERLEGGLICMRLVNLLS